MNKLSRSFRIPIAGLLPAGLLLMLLVACEGESSRQLADEPSSETEQTSTVAMSGPETTGISATPTTAGETGEPALPVPADDQSSEPDTPDGYKTALEESVETTAEAPAKHKIAAASEPPPSSLAETAPVKETETGSTSIQAIATSPVPQQEPAAGPEPIPSPGLLAEPEVPAVATTGASQAAPPPVTAGAPPLDLDSLETRLRKTKAIGVFTKLELKGQVEDLVREVDRYHQSKSELNLEQLEEHFDLLVMKLLILVQDGDPGLSREIASARPTLWTALADPVQFSAIKGP